MKQTMLSQLMKVCLLRAATRVARRCTWKGEHRMFI
jgi:hypothetical protein